MEHTERVNATRRWKKKHNYPTTAEGRALWAIRKLCENYEKKYAVQLQEAREKMAEDEKKGIVEEAESIVRGKEAGSVRK